MDLWRRSRLNWWPNSPTNVSWSPVLVARSLPSPFSCTHPLVCVSAVACKGFGDAGLVPAVLALLTSTDPELLHHAARAASRTCRDSRESPRRSYVSQLGLEPRGAWPALVM